MFQSNFKIQVSLMSYQYKTFNSSVFIINTLKFKKKIRPFSYTNSKYNDSTPPPPFPFGKKWKTEVDRAMAALFWCKRYSEKLREEGGGVTENNRLYISIRFSWVNTTSSDTVFMNTDTVWYTFISQGCHPLIWAVCIFYTFSASSHCWPKSTFNLNGRIFIIISMF